MTSHLVLVAPNSSPSTGERLEQKELQFKASLGYILRLFPEGQEGTHHIAPKLTGEEAEAKGDNTKWALVLSLNPGRLFKRHHRVRHLPV